MVLLAVLCESCSLHILNLNEVRNGIVHINCMHLNSFRSLLYSKCIEETSTVATSTTSKNKGKWGCILHVRYNAVMRALLLMNIEVENNILAAIPNHVSRDSSLSYHSRMGSKDVSEMLYNPFIVSFVQAAVLERGEKCFSEVVPSIPNDRPQSFVIICIHC